MNQCLCTELGKHIYKTFIQMQCVPRKNFLVDMEKLAFANILNVQEMCDYLDMSVLEFLVQLVHFPDAISKYRKVRIQQKISVNNRLQELIDMDVTVNPSIVFKAAEFISHHVQKNTLLADKIELQKKDLAHKISNDNKHLKLDKKQHKLHIRNAKNKETSDFIKYILEKDEDTLEKIKKHIK